MPDGASWKSCRFCLASWTKSLQETWRKLARLYQAASEFYFVYKKGLNLVLSGSIWPASFNFPSNFWSRKPDRTSNFLSGSVWHDFVWLSGLWCSQGISLPPLDRLFSAPWSLKSADFFSFHLEFWVFSFSFFLVLLGFFIFFIQSIMFLQKKYWNIKKKGPILLGWSLTFKFFLEFWGFLPWLL